MTTYPLVPQGHPVTWHKQRYAPFDDWGSLVSFLKNLQKCNDDAMILMDGLEGSGKSSLAFQLCRALDPNWNPDDHLVLDFDDWLRVQQLNPGQVILIDEGGDLLFSRNHMKKESKALVQVFQQARIYNHIVVVVAPNLRWLDAYIREHRALIYGQVLKEHTQQGTRRGIAKLYFQRRRWNGFTGEWETKWGVPVFEAYFKGLPARLPLWLRYEAKKRSKVQSQMEAMRQQ